METPPIIINNNVYQSSDGSSNETDDSDQGPIGGNSKTFTFKKVERKGLSISLELKRYEEEPGAPRTKTIHNPKSAEALAWNQPTTSLPDTGSTCELLNIQALEYSADDDGLGKTTLICPGGPMKDSDSATVQLRWLLVLNCPHISNELTAVAVTLLDDVERRHSKMSESGAYIEPGTVLRCVGKYMKHAGNKEQSLECETAYFLSSPHIDFRQPAAKTGPKEGYGPRSLLQYLYGYDLDDGTTKQIVQKMAGGKTKEHLHVNQVWYLLIGSDVLVTMSDMTRPELQGNGIAVDIRPVFDRGLISICLYDEASRRYNSVVDLDYTYVDLLQHCVSLVRGSTYDAFDYELLNPDDGVLTPGEWLRLVSSFDTNMLTFYFREKGAETRASRKSDAQDAARASRESRAVSRRSYYRDEERLVTIRRGEYVGRDSLPAQPMSPSTMRKPSFFSGRSEDRDLVPDYVRRQRQSKNDWSRRSYLPSPRRSYARSLSRGRRRRISPTVRYVQVAKSYPEITARSLSPSASSGSSSDEKPGESQTQSKIRLDHSNTGNDGLELAPSDDHAHSSVDDQVPPRNSFSGKDNESQQTSTKDSPTMAEDKKLSDPATMPIYKEESGLTAAAAQDVDHTELTMEETSKQSPEKKNWPVVLYNQASIPRVSTQGEDLSAQEVNPSKETTSFSRIDSYPGLLRRRSTGFGSVSNKAVTLYTGPRPKTDGGAEIRVISRARRRAELHGPSRYGNDGSHYGRDNRSDRYASGRYYDKPSRLRDHTIKWTDKVAKSEKVTNEYLYQRDRGTSIFTLKNLSDNETRRGRNSDSDTYTTSETDTTGRGSSHVAFEPAQKGYRSNPRRGSYDGIGGEHIQGLNGAKRSKTVQFHDSQDGARSSAPSNTLVRMLRSEGPHQQPSTEKRPGGSPDVVAVPFLEWPLKNDTDHRDAKDIEKNLIGILTSVNRKLRSGEISRLYVKAFRCTLQDLNRRHKVLLVDAEAEVKRSSVSDQGPIFKQGDHNSELGARDVDSASLNGHQAGKPLGTEGDEEVIPRLPNAQELNVVRPELVMMKELYDISQQILTAFVPKEGSLLSHHIYVHFWGAVDCICRQLLWEANDVTYAGQQYFTIKDYDVAKIGKKKANSQLVHSWVDCPECRNNATYTTASDALSHLHSHRECSSATKRPWDDPCYVWIQSVWGPSGQVPKPRKKILKKTAEFKESLLHLKEQISELHSLVANAWGTRKSKRPPLPTSLVKAFTQLLTLYLLQAQELSLLNRIHSAVSIQGKELRLSLLMEKQQELEMYVEEVNIKVRNLLQDAKKDIVLLGSTTRDIHSLGVEAVGAEFLIMSLVANAQNRRVIPEELVSSRNTTDYIYLYRTYIAQLRFQASKRPQRRLFLDIDVVQEELSAVSMVHQAQSRLLGNYLKLLSPRSFRMTTKTRVGIFKTEKALARRQQRKLYTRIQDTKDLTDKLAYLKERVKQMIEIIEEDHGKAIRVFTIVTLFFLPLSFVSSFMGMNTADIRDMERSQSIFWTTSVPVTTVVLFVALLYGYYGDGIADWLAQKTHTRQPAWKQQQLRSPSVLYEKKFSKTAAYMAGGTINLNFRQDY
ncbi:unnamed protein product [Clonostachys byssicola]|uniref:Magnesium transport protein CorA n=1 Tax=Clonostachys byssicola TaxID=160290 RepID=A0A9N9Y546_9HYPO|nr:unnamed protein product [Clonostachys byssicola]